MIYNSPNAPSKRDVLGTWLLAMRSGHKRYVHITGLRGDAVSPQIQAAPKRRGQEIVDTPVHAQELEHTRPQ